MAVGPNPIGRWLMMLAAVAVGGCSHPQVTDPGSATVVEVVDGDTVELRFGPIVETVRLLGVDTPETIHPTVPEQCFGAEATAELRRLLPAGTEVEVFRDAQSRDHYGRLLLHLRRPGDELAVNLHLVEHGFGAATFYQPNHHDRRRFLDAERQARAQGRGLWEACDGPDQPLN